MNIVDSSAWLAYFANEANADIFAPIIENTQKLIVPSITLTEVFKVVYTQKYKKYAMVIIAQMQQGKVIALDEYLALDAAHYAMKYKLPLADSIIYATNQKYQAQLYTQDADFQGLENVAYFVKK